jgi:molybdate transport system regulatory protein
MKPEFNIWLQVDGEVSLSIWRVRLLEAIAETNSISGAASLLDVAYRVAWTKINEMETRLGKKLVETRVGGRSGGGARLTPLAREYVLKFNQLSQEVEMHMIRRYREIFGDWRSQIDGPTPSDASPTAG